MKHADMLRLVVALIPDPSQMIEHMFELFTVFFADFVTNDYVDKQKIKHAKMTGNPIYEVFILFIKFYQESQVPLPGKFHCNPFFNFIVTNTETLYVPSKVYYFCDPDESYKTLEIIPQESTIFPESIMVITSPHKDVTESLFLTINRITELQPVTDLFLESVSCEELAPEQRPIISKNARSICFKQCKLPLSFLKDLLHQLSGSVTLEVLHLPGMNLKAMEKDLDVFMNSLLESHPKMESEKAALTASKNLKINLGNNQLSPTFKEKWQTYFRRTIIQLSFDDNEDIREARIEETSEDLSMDEINWLIQEQVSQQGGSCDQGPSAKNDDTVVEYTRLSSPGGKIHPEEKAEGLDASTLALFYSVIEKVNETQRNEELSLEEMNWLIQEQELKDKNKNVADKHPNKTLGKTQTENQNSDETLEVKKTEDESPDETLEGKKTEDESPDETLMKNNIDHQNPDKTLKRKEIKQQQPDETLKKKKTENLPPDETPDQTVD